MEPVITEVLELIDGLEGLEVKVNFFLGFSVFHENNSTIKD